MIKNVLWRSIDDSLLLKEKVAPKGANSSFKSWPQKVRKLKVKLVEMLALKLHLFFYVIQIHLKPTATCNCITFVIIIIEKIMMMEKFSLI